MSTDIDSGAVNDVLQFRNTPKDPFSTHRRKTITSARMPSEVSKKQWLSMIIHTSDWSIVKMDMLSVPRSSRVFYLSLYENR